MKRWFAGLLVGLLGCPAYALTINEINYDDDGADFEEFIEIFHAGGGDFSAFDLVLYNGNGGAEYFRQNLGTIPVDGYLVIGVAGVPNVDILFPGATNQIQNGAPDGIAIVQTGTSCVQFLSYEGTFTAVGGECDGVGSTDIGVEDIDPAGPADDVVLQRIPNESGNFIQTGNGLADGVAEDGTPGEVNQDEQPPPDAFGKLTTLQRDATNVTVNLCAGGGDGGPFTFVITEATTNGTLSDNGGAITAPPDHTVSGTLRYTPDTGFSGVDTLTFYAQDTAGSSDPAEHELAVQLNTVVISEVMHSPSSFQSTYEFIEIYNNSGSAVNLTRLDTIRSTVVNTLGNLTSNGVPAVIPANSMRIIAIDNTAGFPESAEDFRCEWRSLRESDIIRIPLDNWEFLFANPDPLNCAESTGSRILLFTDDGELLDAVDLGRVGSSAGDCDAGHPLTTPASTSYDYDDFFDPLNTANNDLPINWLCSVDIPDAGRRTGVTGDVASPAFVPGLAESPTFDPPCVGACCLPDGGCLDGLAEDECLVDNCGISFNLDMTCDQVTCTPVPLNKCCLPIGICQDLTECQCLLFDGDFDGADTCNFPDQSSGECPVEVDLVINELDYANPGTDDSEFIELWGTANLSLIGWSLEFHNGNASTNGPTLLSGSTIDLATAPGAVMPNDGGGKGFLVIGPSIGTVPNVDIPFPGGDTNRIQNGGCGANGCGDGIVLVFNGVVIEALSYDTTTNGFVARGGAADGVLLPDIGVLDGDNTALQKLPDGGTWNETFNNTPGESNFEPTGACCDPDTFGCQIISQADCVALGDVYQGDDTVCDPNPCLPRGACCDPATFGCEVLTSNGCATSNGVYQGDGTECTFQLCFPQGACCLPDGSCAQLTEFNCVSLGGTWNGAGSPCPDIAAFVACVDAGGPDVPTPDGCEDQDLDGDGHVDLFDYYLFQQQFCVADPVGACCRRDGGCEEISQFECEELLGGEYQGDGVSCESVSCPLVGGEIVINEIWSNDAGTDTNEFIELFDPSGGARGASLDGLSIIVVDGDTGGDPTSANYRRINLWLDLQGQNLDAGGFFVAANGPDLPGHVALEDLIVPGFGSTNGLPDDIQNGSQTYALVHTADIMTTNGVQLTDGSVAIINTNAIDTVATLDGDTGDHVYFFAPVVQTEFGLAFGYGQRLPNGTDTNSPADWEALGPNDVGEIGGPADPSTPGDVNQSQGVIPGACCVASVCSDVLEAACNSNGGDFLGHGTDCGSAICACVSIAEAEMLADGTPVCVTDAIISNTFDLINSVSVKNFHIQDEVGTNGIVVFGTNDEIDALLGEAVAGDQIELRGTLDTFFTDRELIAPFTIANLGSPGVPDPFPVTIGDLQDTATAADPLMATLIVVQNAEFAEAVQGGSFAAGVNYTIHDATNPSLTMIVRNNNVNDPHPIVGTTIPSGTVSIVGVANAFSSAWQVAPRVPEDFITP